MCPESFIASACNRAEAIKLSGASVLSWTGDIFF